MAGMGAVSVVAEVADKLKCMGEMGVRDRQVGDGSNGSRGNGGR